MDLIKKIEIPNQQRKRTTLSSNLYYDILEIYPDKVIGYLNGEETMTWYFENYSGIDFVKANMNSQFAQVVFLTGINSKNRAIGVDLFASQNVNAMNDTNRILFCSGMFSFGKTNDFAKGIAEDIKKAYDDYKANYKPKEEPSSAVSAADEILKYKELLDSGIITQEEFDQKKKQLLNL